MGRWCLGAALLLAAVVSPGVSPANAEPTGRSGTEAACSLDPTPGTVQRTIGSRTYWLHVPQGMTGPSRLLLSLHGWGGAAQDMEAATGLSAHADEHKYIVAYPQGTYPDPIFQIAGWDYFHQSSADIDFLRAVVADISGTWCVDPAQVHADGISMGGLMSQRLACEASDAFASVSGHATNDVQRAWFNIVPSEPCSLDRPVSVYLSCGDADAATDYGCAPARDAWASRLACPSPTEFEVPYGILRQYTPCAADTQLWWKKWTGLGHEYPAGEAQDQWHAEMHLFFALNTMP